MPDLKPELSCKNKYWIPKHRYYELKHYCLQYPQWRKIYSSLEFKMGVNPERMGIRGSEPGNPTERYALILADCRRAMELVERCCSDASAELGPFLIKGVTEGLAYESLRALYDIPCGKDMYYGVYRKFFFILSQRRGI